MSALSDAADREWLKKSCAASGVPVLITDPVVIARAAGLLNGGTPPDAAQSKAGSLGPQHDNHSAGC